jgi:ice-binding like protein/exosortase sorting signal-containing protein
MKRKHLRILACFGFIALLCRPSSGFAQVAPSLGAANAFAVLGASVVTNTGSSTVRGNLGINPNNLSSITGFPPGTVFGTTLAAAAALPAQNSVTSAFINLGSQACTADLTGQDLGGQTLTSGVYCFSTSAGLTGTLTLNAQGNPNAVFIFRIGSTLTTASASSVVMSNGGSPCNVFWQVGSSATLGTTTSFAGNILAQASISMNNGASVVGRTLARTGAVTLITNNIDASTCGAAVSPVPIPVPVPVPTLPVWALIALMALLSMAGFAAMRRRAL